MFGHMFLDCFVHLFLSYCKVFHIILASCSDLLMKINGLSEDLMLETVDVLCS